MNSTYKLLFVLTFTLMLNPASATIERGASWDRVCDNGVCTQTLYSGAMNAQNVTGDYVPFESVTSYSWSPQAEGWNFTGTFKNFSAWFILKPYVQHTNGNWYDYSDIKDAFPNTNFTNHVSTHRGGHKFALNITNIPQNLADDIDRIAFSVEDSYNLAWSDITLEHPCVIIKNKVAFCYQDIIDSNFTIQLYNKSVVLIGNVTGKTDLILDPTITLQDADSENLEDTYIDEDNPNTNYGSGNSIKVGESGGIFYGFVKFDISNVPIVSVLEASLNAYIWEYGILNSDNINISVLEISNQTWDEGEITWNGFPSVGSLINYSVNGIGTGWMVWNVTTWVDNQFTNSKTNVSFFLNGTNFTISDVGNDEVGFYSKEGGGISKPYLEITYSEYYATWHDNQSTIPSEYDPSTNSLFNVTWNTSSSSHGISSSFIEGNWSGSSTNYTITNATYGGDIYDYSILLGTGTYYWKSWANVTGDYWNVTDTWIFTIAKNTTNPLSINMSADGFVTNTTDGNISVTTSQVVSIHAWKWFANAGVANLFIVDTPQSNPYSSTFGVGTHKVFANITGNTNYTDNSTGLTFYVISSSETTSGSGSPGGLTPDLGEDCLQGDMLVYPQASLPFTYAGVVGVTIYNYKGENITFSISMSDSIQDYCQVGNATLIAGSGGSGVILVGCEVPPSGTILGNITISGGGCRTERLVCLGAECGLPLAQMFAFFMLFPTIIINLLFLDFRSMGSNVSNLFMRTIKPDLGSVVGWLLVALVVGGFALLIERQRSPRKRTNAERSRMLGILIMGVMAFEFACLLIWWLVSLV